jgi:hypothetical protein
LCGSRHDAGIELRCGLRLNALTRKDPKHEKAVLLILSLALLTASTRAAQPNIIRNGDFDSSAGDCPAGWERQAGSSDELIYASDNPHNGTHFLKLDTRRAEAGKKLLWHLKEPIPLLPGEKYRVEYFFRIDQSNMTGGQTVYLLGKYLDAEKKPLPWREVGQVGLNTGGQARVTTGWCNATYSPDGRMIGTWYWEEMREGVDDHDYLNTLSVLIERLADCKEAAVRRARAHAQNVLSEITEAVQLDVNRSRMERLVYRPVSEEDHDALRWKAAQALERLVRVAQTCSVRDAGNHESQRRNNRYTFVKSALLLTPALDGAVFQRDE